MRTTARIRIMLAKRMGRVMATGEGILVDRKICVCVRLGDEEGDAWMIGGHLRGRGSGARYSHCGSSCGVEEALHYHVHVSSNGDEAVVGMVILYWSIVAGQQCLGSDVNGHVEVHRRGTTRIRASSSWTKEISSRRYSTPTESLMRHGGT